MLLETNISFLASLRRTMVRLNAGIRIRGNTLLLLLFLYSLPSRTFAGEFQDTLQIGIHAGYSGTYIAPSVSPNIFNGVAVGAQVVFGINDFVGIAWDAAFDWHPSYREYLYEEYQNDDGNLSMEWQPGPRIDRYFVSTTALSLVYAIDVSRVVPYLTAGVSGARVDRDLDGVHEAQYALGVRLGGGFDYYFSKFTLGGGVTYDKYLYGNTDHDARALFLLRISYLLRR